MPIYRFLLLASCLFASFSFAQTRYNPEPWSVTRRVRTGRMPETLIAHGGVLYVANEGSNDVDVVFANPRAPVRTIRVGEGPRVLAIVNGLLYIANHRSDTITVIDPKNDCRVVAMFQVGQGPLAGVVAGEFLYVTILYSDRVAVINTRTLRVEGLIEVGTGPRSIFAANGFLFVTTLNAELLVIDLRTRQVVKRFAVGRQEHPPVLLGDFLFFENGDAPGLAVLDTRYLEIAATVPMAPGARILTANGETLYVTGRNDADIQVINWRRPNDDRRVIRLDDPAAEALIYRDFLFVRHTNRPQINVFHTGRDGAFAHIVGMIELEALGLAMELLGPQLCITLETGHVVFVDLDQLPGTFDLAPLAVEPNHDDQRGLLEGLLGRAEREMRRTGFIFE